MYIAEISPAAYRGRLVAITQFNIVLGILLAYLSNYIIGTLHLGELESRWMFGVMALPAVVFLLLLFFTPQSPRWLVAQGRVAEARDVLEQVRHRCRALSTSRLGEIQASLDLTHHRLDEPFFCRRYLKPISLAVAIAVFNQLSGINALIYYTAHIFRLAGADQTSALLQSVIIGFTNLVFTVAALTVIDHFGRRKLMLVGSIGYILSLSTAAYAFYTQLRGVAAVGQPAGLHRGARLRPGGRHLGVHQRDLPESRPGARPGAGQLHPLDHGRRDFVDVPDDRRPVRRAHLRLLRPLHGGPTVWVIRVMPETKGVSLEKIQKRLGIE